ncbi:MAG: sensor histidine kinase [Candidatus Binatia bacterium]
MEGNETQYAEIVKLFGSVLSQYRLYSERHPAAQQAIRNFSSRLNSVLGSESSLTLGLVEGRIVLNDHPLDNKQTGVVELLRECHRLQIESLVFEHGVGEEEISSLFKTMAIAQKTLEEKGGFSKAFEEVSFQHIRLGTTRYKRVKEEEEVVHKAEIGGGEGERKEEGNLSELVRKIERMEEVVEHCLRGTESEIVFDSERLAYELEKRPDGVSKQMVHRAEDLEALKRVVRGMGRFLQERLAQPFIQEGKDFSQPISNLAREFRRVVESPGSSDDFKGSVDELVAVLERSAEAVKLELIVRTFQKSGGDLKSLARTATRFLRGREARDRLLGPLRERLIRLGVAEKDFEQAFTAQEERRTPRTSSRVDVSPEELEELRRIRDNFEEELARRVGEKTVVLEREKRRALDDKERVDRIIRNIGQALVVVDVEGKVQVMNPAAEKLLGLTQAEGKGVAIPQLMKDEHMLALAKGPLRDGADRLAKEIELQSPNDETRRVLQASTAIIENEDGKTVGMLSVLNDITKQKRLEELKSRFVVNVTHELRTPMVAIEQSLGLLLGKEVGEISPQQEKFLSMAQRNLTQLFRVVNDVLDIAKLEAKSLRLRPISFQVGDVVHYAVETVRSWAEDKQLTIEEKYPVEGLMVEADPDRIIQVVTNLLRNAITFTPEMGRIWIEADYNWSDPEISLDPCVAISVKDTGAGIPKGDQQRIFEKFEGSLDVPEGISKTGLGLTLSKEIVELHGGKIWVESKEGEGSRFTFAIPRQLRNGDRTQASV